MSPLPPSAGDLRHLARAVDALTTQLRRLTDQRATPTAEPHTLADGTEAGFRAALAADDEEQLRTTRRDTLLVLLSRASRGVLTTDEAALLRQHVETEMREADTARTRAKQAEDLLQVAHATSNRSEAERARAQAALDRVRRVAALIEAGAPWTASQQDTAARIRAALDGTEQPTTEATELETTTRVFAALHQSAEQDVSRVIDLYERWVKAGPPPLGTPMSRWWDARLVELHDAILPPAEQPTTEPS
ncbi:hypothetical protein GCM10010294_25240 [Streptomyces griseoloalbus]|uniref:hypothetical protein n=1 Tax=Streptomyces griseoloalbus TaxID=67303 RepID=UPI001875BE07|nr:hypothetical protein GCM10010294_25240 [Streptomyces griseoloalbus]